MNASQHVSKYLSSGTQRAFAKCKAGDERENQEAPTQKESTNIALLRRVQRIVFGPNVTDLGEAKTRLNSLIDALDDEEKEAQKKPSPSD